MKKENLITLVNECWGHPDWFPKKGENDKEIINIIINDSIENDFESLKMLSEICYKRQTNSNIYPINILINNVNNISYKKGEYNRQPSPFVKQVFDLWYKVYGPILKECLA